MHRRGHRWQREGGRGPPELFGHTVDEGVGGVGRRSGIPAGVEPGVGRSGRGGWRGRGGAASSRRLAWNSQSRRMQHEANSRLRCRPLVTKRATVRTQMAHQRPDAVPPRGGLRQQTVLHRAKQHVRHPTG